MPTLDSATRDRIVAAATELIMERGYEKTTMRAIAERAEVSLGSAYYYFGGKEELVQGFYLAIARRQHELLEQRIDGVTSFGKRLDACFEAFLDASDEYRAISDSLLSFAIVPTSPLSPFSAQSRPARNQFLRTFEELVDGSDLKTDPRLREALPELLWIAQMLIVLGWVQDLSARQRVTRTVVKRLVPALARLLSAARLAPVRPFVTDALESLAMVRQRTYVGEQVKALGS
ncbi:TetR family transcriptional regulator [Demequina sp.]|uniref:TetR/AcrR family transcriptional regulator n=1 Tax=Demequina sp. TaxID=2050685 RepID=UPI0025C2D46E|nr:TetR family transcriptional regulator [Demequina sp.]